MNKTGKILLNLSAVAIIASIGAQFYTNYKIDQTLKQFPYHFNHEFTIQVEERNSDFFTRDLVFSLQRDEEKSDFIHTELTILPFAIQAKSYLTADIIKALNKNLNITIDKHNINSQFSIFSNQLQSIVNTEFRDITNTSQTQETEINYITENKNVTINTQLSGWNNEQITLKGIKGEYVLNPAGNSAYDLTQAYLEIKHTDINLLDGENTHIELQDGKYQLNKSNNKESYDLNLAAHYKNIIAYNKKTKNSEKQFQLNELKISSQQKSVISNINFLQQIKNLDSENIDIQNLANLILDFLFNNDEYSSKIEINSANFSFNDSISKINQAKFEFNTQNKEKRNNTQKINLNLGEISIQSNNEYPIELNLKNGMFSSKMSNINLTKELIFLKKYIPQNIKLSFAEKDNKDFIKDLNTLTEEYQTKTESAVKIDEVSIKNVFSLKDFNYTYRDDIKENLFNIENNIKVGNLNLKNDNMQFNNLNVTLPMELAPKNEYIKMSYCSQHIYPYFCMTNLTPETYYNKHYDLLNVIATNIKNAILETNIDTIPQSKNSQKITINLDLSVPKGDGFNVFDKLLSTESNIKISIPTALFKELTENQENHIAKIKKETPAWQTIYQFTSENSLIDNENYIMNFDFKDGLIRLNGKEFKIYY
ncbi:MAG: hypothetical protein Q4B95_07325 [Lonepinella koalarum]|nr:hypothetical protein [Lonepinella koalarum]